MPHKSPIKNQVASSNSLESIALKINYIPKKAWLLVMSPIALNFKRCFEIKIVVRLAALGIFSP